MKPIPLPEWSFLAVEPLARAAIKRCKVDFEKFDGPRSSLSERKEAFWRLFAEVENEFPGGITDPVLRSHRAIQWFYALIDLSTHRTLADRDMQRWLNFIVEPINVPTHAAVQQAAVSKLA